LSVLSASADRTLRLWARASGAELLRLLLPGDLGCVAIAPSGAPIVCGDSGGSVHLLEVVGLELGPLIVTAVDFGEGLVVRCPWCNAIHPFQEPWRGQQVACPACEGALKVNEFVVERRRG
jgi:hypothetical protein